MNWMKNRQKSGGIVTQAYWGQITVESHLTRTELDMNTHNWGSFIWVNDGKISHILWKYITTSKNLCENTMSLIWHEFWSKQKLYYSICKVNNFMMNQIQSYGISECVPFCFRSDFLYNIYCAVQWYNVNISYINTVYNMI